MGGGSADHIFTSEHPQKEILGLCTTRMLLHGSLPHQSGRLVLRLVEDVALRSLGVQEPQPKLTFVGPELSREESL